MFLLALQPLGLRICPLAGVDKLIQLIAINFIQLGTNVAKTQLESFELKVQQSGFCWASGFWNALLSYGHFNEICL